MQRLFPTTSASVTQTTPAVDTNKLLSIIKAQTREKNTASILTSYLTDDDMNIIIDDSFSLLKLMGPNELLLMPGRSPAFHAFILKAAGKSVLHFPCSGHFYTYNCFPTETQLKGMRSNLVKFGITPEILSQSAKIRIFDYFDTGACIEGLLMLFAHWQYDISHNNGNVSSSTTFHADAHNTTEYKSIYDKFVIHGFNDYYLSSYPFPHLDKLPYFGLRPRNGLSNALYANAVYVRTHYFPSECWELDASTIRVEDLNPDYARKVAIQEERLLNKLRLRLDTHVSTVKLFSIGAGQIQEEKVELGSQKERRPF
jgi:hypothetical protein